MIHIPTPLQIAAVKAFPATRLGIDNMTAGAAFTTYRRLCDRKPQALPFIRETVQSALHTCDKAGEWVPIANGSRWRCDLKQEVCNLPTRFAIDVHCNEEKVRLFLVTLELGQ
ncbi:MAG TPA: hypothetical protein VEC13_03245 [Candidatus Paceibacterota bacterium]|nr:hypothetical protein [Candidatus Paceibacterota bacterium]